MCFVCFDLCAVFYDRMQFLGEPHAWDAVSNSPKSYIPTSIFQRSRHTRGGTVKQQTTPANRDHYYPDSLLFVSVGFLPRVSSQRLN